MKKFLAVVALSSCVAYGVSVGFNPLRASHYPFFGAQEQDGKPGSDAKIPDSPKQSPALQEQEPNQDPQAPAPGAQDRDQTPVKAAPRPKGNQPDMSVEYNKLNAQAKKILLHKGTERPWTGKLLTNKSQGTYICRRCNAPLYDSSSKFESNCGWPSFDDEIEGAVRREMDADGLRIEILCENCGGHLGHVFHGEQFTPKNTRHCVNSLSMNFVAANKPLPPVIRPKTAAELEQAKESKTAKKGKQDSDAKAADSADKSQPDDAQQSDGKRSNPKQTDG